jgi:hypothetical protein
MMPIRDFLLKYHAASLTPVVEENPDASFLSILRKMVDHKVHHVFTVTKNDHRPAGLPLLAFCVAALVF